MGKIIALILVILAGYYVYTNVDFDKVKADTMETLKKEKTINTINTRRNQEQSDVYQVINGNIK